MIGLGVDSPGTFRFPTRAYCVERNCLFVVFFGGVGVSICTSVKFFFRTKRRKKKSRGIVTEPGVEKKASFETKVWLIRFINGNQMSSQLLIRKERTPHAHGYHTSFCHVVQTVFPGAVGPITSCGDNSLLGMCSDRRTGRPTESGAAWIKAPSLLSLSSSSS